MRAVRMRSLTGVGALVLCLLAAAPASAAFTRAPVVVGPGDGASPSVEIDPAGTAHVAWGVGEDLIGYCALPRGARQCAVNARFSLDARAGRPVLMRRASDGVLIVVAGREDLDDDPDGSVWAFTSADGATWSAPAPIGLGLAEIDAAVLTADGQAVDLLQSSTGGNLFQRAPLAGPPSAELLNLSSTPAGPTSEFNYPGDMVRLASGRTMAFIGSPADGFAYRVLSGADPYADPSWLPWPARRVTQEWDEPRAAAGPRGAYVMYGVHILDQTRGAAPQVVRKYRGTRWGRPRGVFYEINANTDRAALAQDGKGRLHAAIVGFDWGGQRECVAYARTHKRRWFTRAVSVHKANKEAEHPGRVRLAVDQRGRGVVAWAAAGTARVQWLKAGRGVTRPTNSLTRGCPPFPR